MEDAVAAAAATIAAKAAGFAPRVGLVLGSGLGDFIDRVQPVAEFGYDKLAGFPLPSVEGHAGRLCLGRVGDTDVAVLQGRAHYYESGRADAMKVPVRTLKRLGCEVLVLTNSGGSLRGDVGPGSLVALSDHVNLVGVSPLFGETGSDRFVDMTDAYDPALRARLHEAAERTGITLHDGVYAWFGGPNFETPAEIRAAARLGADVAGMSTVPEVILARHAGLKVAALSVITNLAAGMSTETLSHAQTMAVAARAATAAADLLTAFLVGLAP